MLTFSACTHKDMYAYLPPTDPRELEELIMYGTGFCLISRQRQFYLNIFRWMVMCSLDEVCIRPKGSGQKFVLLVFLFIENERLNSCKPLLRTIIVKSGNFAFYVSHMVNPL